MKNWKKIFAMLMALTMLLSLAACGGGGESSDPNAGMYVAQTAEMWGIEMEISDMFEDGFSIELKDKGKCSINADGTKGSGKWELNGSVITISFEGEEMSGTLENGVMVLEDVLGMGVTMTMVKEGAQLQPSAGNDPTQATEVASMGSSPFGEAGNASSGETTPVETTPVTTTPVEVVEELTVNQAYWNGGWYGWWLIDEGTASGQYADWDGGYWDCCWEVQLDENDVGTLIMWDTDFSREEPMAVLDVEISGVDGQVGRLKTVGGYFIDDTEMGMAKWLIDPQSGLYEDMVLVDNCLHTNTEDFFEQFYYTIYMRPWGRDWEDVAQEEPYGLPDYYYDWYLPLIENDSAMPSVIGGEVGAVVDSGNAEQPEATTPPENTTAPDNTAAPVDTDFGDSATQVYTVKDKVSLTYPTDVFTYDDFWEKLEHNTDPDISISIVSSSQTLAEEKAQYQDASYVNSTGYSLKETTVAGYNAIICTYSDSMYAYMDVVLDLAGAIDSPNFVCAQISVTAGTAEALTDPVIMQVINTFAVASSGGSNADNGSEEAAPAGGEESADGGYYGKSNAGATGYVSSQDTLQAVVDYVKNKENGVYPSYEEFKEMFGGVDGKFDESRSDEKRNYYYWYLDGNEDIRILIGFDKLSSGDEEYSSATWVGL